SDVTDAGSHCDDITREFVTEDDGKPRETGIPDVALRVGFDEMKIRPAEANTPKLDQDIQRSGCGRFQLTEPGTRMAPHAAADQCLALGSFRRRWNVARSGIPIGVDDKGLHDCLLPTVSAASSSAPRVITFAMASAYCSMTCGG